MAQQDVAEAALKIEDLETHLKMLLTGFEIRKRHVAEINQEQAGGDDKGLLPARI